MEIRTMEVWKYGGWRYEPWWSGYSGRSRVFQVWFNGICAVMIIIMIIIIITHALRVRTTIMTTMIRMIIVIMIIIIVIFIPAMTFNYDCG